MCNIGEVEIQSLVYSFFTFIYKWLNVVTENNWSFSIDHSWRQILQFILHLVDFLTILLCLDCFARIQKLALNGSKGYAQTVVFQLCPVIVQNTLSSCCKLNIFLFGLYSNYLLVHIYFLGNFVLLDELK